jgi:TonB-linked SusC/RagA family outer membrane protein
MYKFYTRKLGVPERLYHKIWLIMRLTTVILIASLIQVSAATFAQRITLNQRNTPLESVFKEIRKQSGYDFFYDGKAVKPNQKVSISVTDVSVEDALRSVLKDLPFTYEISDNRITIRKKEEPSFFDNIKAVFAAIDVHGRVVDEKGQPLPGVTIKVKDGSLATTTDGDGSFILRKVNERSIIRISYIGYLTKEVPAISELGTILMEISSSKLNEIQIIAYGQVERKFSTSDISSVKSDQISTQPVDNPLLALSGRVPGLFVKQTGGVAGSPVNITVQGNNSMSNSNDPFYVIDGVPFVSKNIYSNLPGSSQPGLGGSTFSYINPSDIESIEILKDADATAIYGSRAANGAILITTKKGKAGKTKVDINSQTGWGKITKQVKLLNTEQYVDIRREALKNNGGQSPSDGDYDINGVYDLSRNTNWQDLLVGGTARFTNLQATVSGGSANTQFYVGAGYVNQTTVYPGDLGDNKANIHFNINHVSPNQKFKFNFSGSYLQDNNTLSTSDLMSSAVTLVPNAPALYNANGDINWAPDGNNPATSTFQNNPIAYLYSQYNAKTYNLVGNSLISYEIIPGLELKSTFGYNRINSDEFNLIPIKAILPENLPYSGREANYGNKYTTTYIIEPQITYSKNTLGGHLDVLFGSTFQQSDGFMQAFHGQGYTTDAQLKDISAATTINVVGSNQYTYRYSALFGRANYRFKDKYIINLSARRDGSSRFGSENLFNNFYSIGTAWLFGDEVFSKNLLPFLSAGKLRISYGTTGNDQIGDYGFLNLYQTYYVDVPYQNQIGLVPTGHSNPFLQWEETRKLNFGIDLGFFNNRISATVNYFRNRSSNQLLLDPVPIYTGFASFRRNLPATVQNTGLELQLDAALLKTNQFKWNTSINLTVPRNKLTSYPNLAQSYNSRNYILGQPYNIVKVFHYLDVNPQTGLYEFQNSTGGITSKPSGSTDKISFVNLNPKFYGGFYNSFSYKGFNLDFLLQYVKQIGYNNRFGSFPGISIQNQPVSILRRWQKPGDVTDIQKISTNFGEVFSPYIAATNSDAAYSDASFIRLKNASLSYTLPDGWTQRAHIGQARLYIQGQNLLTFTKFPIDPESQTLGSLPPLRLFTVGFQLTLN